MADIIDFASASQQVKDRRVIRSFLDEGLNSVDLAILSLASNRAFTGEHIPTAEEAAAMGTTALRFLVCYVTDDECGSVYEFHHADRPVLKYIIATQPMTFDWHESTALHCPLVDEENPGSKAALLISDHLAANGVDAISLYGHFALDAFYFAAISPLSALHLQIFPGRNTAGMLLYDAERSVEIVMVAEMDNWTPLEADLVAEKMLRNQEKDKTIQCLESNQ